MKGTLGSAGDADSLRIRISVLSAVRNAQSNNTHTRGCEKTRLSFFAALFYFIAMRSLRIAYIYFLYTLLKCDSKSIYYESPRKSCSIQHHCYPYILRRSMPVHSKEHHKAYSCTHQKS